ncbi:MAG: DHH family phosphoesterase [Cellulosilyticaceae bacterium]
MVIDDILSELEGSEHILITAHTNPDGDAVGAMVAMGHFCKIKGINYTVLLEEKNEKYEFLLEDIVTTDKYDGIVDCILALDCGNVERLVGYNEYVNSAKKVIVIDHHVTNTGYGTYNWVVSNASSTSELIYQLFKHAHVAVCPKIATALYTGIISDTGGFRHSCTQSSTHNIVAELMETEFDFTMIYNNLLCTKSLTTIKIQNSAVENMIEVKEGIYLSYITKEQMLKVNAKSDDLGSVVGFLKSIENINVIAFIYEKDDNIYKLSTRSDVPYNMAEFCQQFDGGGHERASGATLRGSLNQVIEMTKEALLVLE